MLVNCHALNNHVSTTRLEANSAELHPEQFRPTRRIALNLWRHTHAASYKRIADPSRILREAPLRHQGAAWRAPLLAPTRGNHCSGQRSEVRGSAGAGQA